MDKEAPEKRLVDWAIIEQIGIPMTVLAAIAYGISKVWVWLSESLIKEIYITMSISFFLIVHAIS